MVGRVGRLVLTAGALAIAAGCVALPTGGLKGALKGETVTTTGKPTTAVAIASLTGTLLGPKAGLISNNGAGIISNNSGGLISNNGGGVISDHGGSYRVLHVTDLAVPAPYADVTVVDAAGRLLTTKPARSDKDGRFKLTGLKPASGVIFVKATYAAEGQTVTLMAAIGATSTISDLTVDPATTLVAKKLSEDLRTGAVKPEAVKPAALAEAAKAIAAAMSPRAVVAAAILPEDKAAGTYDAMLKESAELARAIGDAEAQAEVTPASAAPGSVAPSKAPSASPSGGASKAPASSAPGASPTPTPSPTAAPTPKPNAGVVTTYAGAGDPAAGDGPRATATFSRPEGLTLAANGVLYVADAGNNKIRKIAADGTVSTVAGSGAAGAKNNTDPLVATFRHPEGLAIDAAGNLFVADRDNHRIRKIATNGAVTTFAGSGQLNWADGVGTAAAFNEPTTLVFLGADLYVCDSHNHCIRKITPDGTVSTFAGSNTAGEADGLGGAASFQHPTGFNLGADGNFYVVDEDTGHARKITPAGQVTTLPGTFDFPGGVCADKAGTVYVAEMNGSHLKRITKAGVVDDLAGSDWGFADGTGASAQFDSPMGLQVDDQGRVWMADVDNNRIRIIQ